MTYKRLSFIDKNINKKKKKYCKKNNNDFENIQLYV